jgi:hypothetical protein
MAVRLLIAFADNEGHLPPMRYLVLSPFPPSNGDHVDPFGPKTHSFQLDQEPRPSAASSLPDSARRQANPHGTPKTTFVPGWAASTRARRPIPIRRSLPGSSSSSC